MATYNTSRSEYCVSVNNSVVKSPSPSGGESPVAALRPCSETKNVYNGRSFSDLVISELGFAAVEEFQSDLDKRARALVKSTGIGWSRHRDWLSSLERKMHESV